MTNKEFVKKWVEALRSNKYKQGQHMLKNINSYCCLGVGVLVAQEMGCQEANKQLMGKGFPDYNWWQAFVGLTWEGEVVNYKGNLCHLTELNDTYKLSFTEIADLIEKKWLNEDLT